MTEILIIYYSKTGHTKKLAKEIANGAMLVENCDVKMRTVLASNDSNSNAMLVTKADLKSCHGLAFGSPTRFGNIASPLQSFLETTSDLWLSGSLIGKPAALFTSSGSLHGGQESTLLSMSLPLLHHGMLLLGIPYSCAELSKTKSGGTPYGASHFSGNQNNLDMTDDERIIARNLGERLAQTAKMLMEKS